MSKLPELVYWYYFDGQGLFSDKNTKEALTTVYLKSEEGRKILETGSIAVLSSRVSKDPYFSLKTQVGFTRRARKHGELRNKMSKEYPELRSSLKSVKSKLMDYNEYVYIDLPHLDNSVNPMYTSENEKFFSVNFVKKEYFTPEFIKELVSFRPQALFGGTITDYYVKHIPVFLSELKLKFPDIFNGFMEINTDSSIEDSITFKGKSAKVKTLNKGIVKYKMSLLENFEFQWNGKELNYSKELSDGNTVNYCIVPNDDTVVEILEEDTVNENTILIN